MPRRLCGFARRLIPAVLPVLLFVSPLAERAFAAGPAGLKSRFARHLCRFGFEGRAPWESSEEACRAVAELTQRASAAVTGESIPAEKIDRLNHFFFEEAGFHPNYDLTSPDHLLVAGVLAGKKGHCVGLASVYLILAEELDLPVHAVATPKHVFLRWDDGAFRRNIELFQNGREVPDDEYVREQKIPKESIDQGVFLANLTPRQFLGFVYQNLGVLHSQRGDLDKSTEYYAWAIARHPRLAAAYYNRGNDYLKLLSYRRAIRDYTKALELYPTDVWALHNRGLAWKGLGKIDKAERDWARAQEIEPGFRGESLRRGEGP